MLRELPVAPFEPCHKVATEVSALSLVRYRAAVTNRRSLYCGERCRQIAELVRYARRKLADGTYDRPDIAKAIMIRRSQLVLGFYDKRARKVAEEVRQDLLARSNGRCEKRGCELAEEGDARFTAQHTSTENGVVPEARCYRCNMDHAQSVSITLSGEQAAFVGWFEFWVRAPEPVLL